MQNEYAISIPHETSPLQLYGSGEAAILHTKLAAIRDLLALLQVELENLHTNELPDIREDFDFYREVERFERNLIQNALRMCGGSQVKAARLLKLKPTTLNSKMKVLRLLSK